MNIRKIGGYTPILEVQLNEGETIMCEAGAMIYASSSTHMESMVGGLFAAIKKWLTGETIAVNKYTGPGVIGLSASSPGMIRELDLGPGQSVDVCKGAFMAGDITLSYGIERVWKGILPWRFLFGGQGFFYQKLTGPGRVFVVVKGDLVEVTLAQGQKMDLDQGYMAYKDPSVDVDLTRIKGLRKVFIGGEGLFLLTATGPGKVGVQSTGW
ncbi:MAG: AIM24 family protein [Candidatus Undinarchaeales archaeon]|nr:AIM24 family protein [Candidatus Undinarchaeales archaeon]MDP7492304.1 AIM24 family protein [Candidatus Undinarchaeales archaeon]